MSKLKYRNVVPLIYLPQGVEGTILSIEAGMGLVNRLYSMNIRPGKKVRRVSEFTGGPVAVRVGETLYGIGKGMAAKIMVGYDEIDEES
ncbi:MAG: ferrous iron transport protein A [Candidatus Aenigmarchaeota archaeon]|nr:ferrous iron transport protein A [Candidatus Aenigmarchaeota archaeon]